MSNNRNSFRLNVGFIKHQTVGYSRDFPFDFPAIHLVPDLDLVGLLGYARITRTAQGLLIQLKMKAAVTAECVRCLTDFLQPLEIEFTELCAFSPNSMTESGLLLPEDDKLDLEPIIREEMLLSMPINPICNPDCQGFCPICGENLNETTCSHEVEDIDPRLDILKSLLDED